MIYLDNAATTLQKPEEVYAAVSETMQRCASPGRGSYPASARAAEALYACREEASALFDVPDPSQITFTSGATQGLNTAIRTLVRPGDRAVISAWEHNAVTRTLHAIGRVDVQIAAAPLFDDEKTVAAFEQQVTPETAAVVCTHVSNVFGYILPLRAIADICHARGVPLVVDAAQSAGCVPLSWRELGAAFIAMPGHKGLYGPQGTGILICGPEYPPVPMLTGGTGSESIRQEMPDFLPDRLEAGTQNVPGVGGLCAGIRFVRRLGVKRIQAHESRLCEGLWRALADVRGIRSYHAADARQQSGVLSLVAEGTDCEELGEALGQNGFAVRAGLHCAPGAHRSAGTLESGTVRVSFSVFNSGADVRALARFLAGASFMNEL